MKETLTERAAAFGVGLGVLTNALSIIMAFFTGVLSFAALLPLPAALTVLCLLAWVRARLQRLANEEKRDLALLEREQPAASLFNRDETTAAFSIAQSHRQVERFIAPAVAPLLGFVLAAWAWWLFGQLDWSYSEPVRLALSASVLGSLAFVLYLGSRFLTGLSRHPEARLLRAPGILAGLVCRATLLGLAGAGAEHFGWTMADEWAARIILAVTGVIAAEFLVNSLLSLYGGNAEDRAFTTESRLGALVVDPGLLTRSMTEAMDYQFGFSFSRTWFFTALRKAVIPLVTAQALLLYGMSSLVFLGPYETGILERFGRPDPSGLTLGPGLHVKLPWPLETVRRIPTGRIHLIEVGFQPTADHHRLDVLTWTAPHYEQEDVFLIAGENTGDANDDTSDAPVGMISVSVPVEFIITNAQAYAYRYADPQGMLRHMAYQTITRHLARRNIDDLFSEQRMVTSDAMRADLQAAADQRGLGVKIAFFGLQGVHPPVPVADAFQAVVGALEEREAIILEARAYTNRVLPVARAFTDAEQTRAEDYRFRRATLADAESHQFDQRQAAHAASPAVYRMYSYLAALRDVAGPARLYVLDLPANGPQTLWLNLEEKMYSGALELAPLMMEDGLQ